MKVIVCLSYLCITLVGLSQKEEIIKNTLAQFPANTEFAIGLVSGNSVEFIGYKKIKKKIKIIENSKSIFEIGSITKAYTATLAYLLAQKKEIAFSDQINGEKGLNFANSDTITYLNLLNHSSGLPRLPPNLMEAPDFQLLNPYATYGEKELLKYLASDIKLEFEPGEISSYSNLGMGLVGYLLEQKTSLSFEELLKSNIFKPLEMNQTTSRRKNIEGTIVQGLNGDGLPTSEWDFQALAGCGALLSSVEDQVKFIQYQWEDASLDELHHETIKINDEIAVGIGWHIFTRKNWIWHNGRTYGFSSCMAINKETKQGVVILSNVSAFHSLNGEIDNLCFKLLKNQLN